MLINQDTSPEPASLHSAQATPGQSATEATAAHRRGDHELASYLFRAAVAADPGCVHSLLGLGQASFAMGDLAGAARAFERAAALRPDDQAAGLSHAVIVACLSVLSGQPLRGSPFMGWPRPPTQRAENFSLTIPVYNTNIAHLHECLVSVLAQTRWPRRITVVDDASTHPLTRAYLSLLRHDADLTLVEQPRNLWLGPTMNHALERCETEYLLKLDSDDIARPGLVQAYEEHLETRGAADFVGCQMRAFGDSDYVTNHPSTLTKQHAAHGPGFWFCNNTGVLLNRDSALSAGGYGRVRGFPDDYPLWVRMILRGRNRFRNLPETLLDYRSLATGIHSNYVRVFTGLQLRCCKLALRAAPAF